MAKAQKVWDIKDLTIEELIHLLNQESVKWGMNIKYGDTMTGILGSAGEPMMYNGSPKTDENGKTIYRADILRKNAKDELKAIKVKIAGDKNPFDFPEGTKVIIKNPVYHRGYFHNPDGSEVKWENITADAIKKA